MTSQTNRSCSVVTPSHANLLFFNRMKGHEEMGRLFEYEVDLLSKQKNIEIGKVFGEPMTIALQLPKGGTRYFNGIVTQFKQYGAFDDFFLYRAVLRPKLWLLTRSLKSRIFQEKSVKEVIEKVLKENGIILNMSASGGSDIQEYCVQYRESDFDFVSRLMEQEGFYYYFKHSLSGHELFITDSMNSHKTIAKYEVIPYDPVANEFGEAIQEWHCIHEVTSSDYGLLDYDFEKPRSLVKNGVSITKTGAQGKCKDYLGDYNDKNVKSESLAKYARTRLEELQTDYEVFRAKSTATAVSAGMLFSLSGHYVRLGSQNNVVVSVDFVIVSNDFRSGDDPFSKIPFSNNCGPDTDFSSVTASLLLDTRFECCFSAIPSTQQFRPRRITPTPVIQGAQTAIVTEECDKYGRVKIKFHWNEEAGSCWVRVSHPMAGKKFGWIALPLVNEEVIVNFVEGNPNRPIITGRVYNGDQMPPYSLPDNKTQSGIKTVNSNELRFEDKEGEEEIYLHAQKDLKCVVLNNETREIKKDRTAKTTGDDSLKVQGKCIIESTTSIELKVGSNSIKIDQQGITVKGVMVTVEGTAKLDAKSPMTTVNGDGTLILKGGMTMIN